MKALVLAAALVVVSWCVSIIWWRLWFYQGFAEPPDILSRLFQCDGERCYDFKEIEMFVLSFLVLFCVAVLSRLHLKR